MLKDKGRCQVQERSEVQEMRKKNRPRGASSQPEFDPGGTEKQQAKEQYDNTSEQEEIITSSPEQEEIIDNPPEQEEIIGRPVIPAKLPPYSQAAIAQRLNDVPERSMVGFVYDAPQLRLHPAGWRTQRHVKRKLLRRFFMRATAVERQSARMVLNGALIGLTLSIIFAVIFVTISSIASATQEHFGDQVVRLEDVLPKDSLRAYDIHGQLVYEAIDQGLQVSVPLSKISPHMINAQVAIEDRTFWKNSGIDVAGITRAALDNVSHGHVVSGGSTITQQLIKNAIVGNKETVMRKLQEITLAPSVTQQYTKQEVLNMYLNTAYYGEQAYGVEAAAFTYFDLPETSKAPAASKLDIAQSAMLAGIVNAPSAHDPYLHPKAALTRMQEVLQQMYQQGYITGPQRDQAIHEAQQPNFLHRGVVNHDLAPHFDYYMRKELADIIHVKLADLSRSGLIVSTTLDLSFQNQVLKIAQDQIAALKGHNVTDAAEVVIDHHTGAIRTLLGNIDPEHNNYDVASEGFRQPGSSFKPFAYITGFEQGISPGMPVVDGPITIQMCCGLPAYTPQNYSNSFMGLISWRTALQNSLNIPALKMNLQVGYDKTLQTAQNMGITEYQGSPNLTLVLGSLGIHLIDETSAYGAFGNHGIHVQKHSINAIRDTSGRLVYQFDVKTNSQQVITPQAAFVMTDVLSDNVARTTEFGKCSPLWLYSTSMNECYAGNPGTVRPAGGKTGTTNDFKDSWTVGYTTDYVVGAWTGNDDNSQMVDVTGIMGAAPIWHDTMLLAERGRPIQNFSGPPPGVVKKKVTYPGLTTTDWYIAG
jgi:penicillin-binding protein 1A